MLEEKFKKPSADELIASLYRNAERIRTREVQKAYNRLIAGGDERHHQQVLVDLTGSIVKKLLFELTESLKEAAISGDLDLMLSANKLFRLKGD